MKEVEIHGYKMKYDHDELGAAGEASVKYLMEKVDKEEAHDLFNGARLDGDSNSRLDFYDRHHGVEREMRIHYNGDGTYRLKKAS